MKRKPASCADVTDILRKTEEKLLELEGLALSNPNSSGHFRMMAHGCISMSQKIVDYLCYDQRTPTVISAAYDVAYEWIMDSWPAPGGD